MAQGKSSSPSAKSKQVGAGDVCQLTSEMLQAHFNLDMSSRSYEPQDFWMGQLIFTAMPPCTR